MLKLLDSVTAMPGRPWIFSSARSFSVSCVNHGSYSFYHNYREKPEFRRKKIAKSTRWAQEKLAKDPQHRDTLRRAVQRSVEQIPYGMTRIRLSNWARNLPWFFELPWEEYVPVRYSVKTQHYCPGCNFERPGGRKLWWQSRSQFDKWLCNNCYAKKYWPHVLPTGYEGVSTARELRARKAELEEIADRNIKSTESVQSGVSGRLDDEPGGKVGAREEKQSGS